MTTTIVTNNQFRHTLDWNQLTAKEREAFHWLDTEERQQDATFVRYRHAVYCVGEFLRLNKAADLPGWHGYTQETYFSGVLMKVNGDGDICMGRFYS